MQSPWAVEVTDLKKSYGGAYALRGISMHVGWGQLFGFLGPNGAGKSTLIQILTTLMLPTSGSATVAGYDVNRDHTKIRFQIGVALQDTGVDPLLTGWELLTLQARLFGMNRQAARVRATELLAQFGLSEVANKRVRTYSGGMRRRLDLALALVHRPSILFLDEPTTGLDPMNRMSLWSLLREIGRESQTTIFLTTQYLEEADALCDQIAIINHGEIIAEDTPAGLKRIMKRDVIEVEPESPSAIAEVVSLLQPHYKDLTVDRGVVRLIVPHGANEIGSLMNRLQEKNIALASLKVTPPTLDDVFLELTGHGQHPSQEGKEKAVTSP
ncbi:ATP-binding cassette domain-containing protein [Alicyclobacillus sp. ALC3]|uniref:ATP-binding cassette domain-containing protein n=1 Tax=Alicyclobacillus sp. ALC3 TaxID=2796143 RepID=UPI0023794315|nr:ATP-binding cassette domain-containing protein [Alicyclobacillus sp. ALC3]WDL95687.1 ATP-binding cassette domain-containing protein [Alicyclobacillus sp. ALC3]